MISGLKTWYVNSFVNDHFKGNPACVVIDPHLPDKEMQEIATGVGLPETAFIDPSESSHSQIYNLRWFTPDIEMDLCGHATLASAWVVFNILNSSLEEVIFETISGRLVAEKDKEGYICMKFPIRRGIEADLPENIYNSLNIKPSGVFKSRDYLLIYDSEEDIRNIEIDREEFDKLNLDPGGVIVSAKGEEVDFVSRFFTPQSTILEDPVTGSAHSTLYPYWSEILKKDKLKAWQLSERGGELICEKDPASNEYFILKGYAAE